jgi:hypothetical protein
MKNTHNRLNSFSKVNVLQEKMYSNIYAYYILWNIANMGNISIMVLSSKETSPNFHTSAMLVEGDNCNANSETKRLCHSILTIPAGNSSKGILLHVLHPCDHCLKLTSQEQKFCAQIPILTF